VSRLAALVVVVLAVAACGGKDETTLSRAEEAMADVEAGRMDVELTASAPDVAKPIGFKVEGTFDVSGDGELPVLDFTYTELLADDENVATVTSDGNQVVVDVDGQEHVLSADDAGSLRMGDDDGFADLGIASWVKEPNEEKKGDQTVVTGKVDAADLLSDIARIAAQVNAEGDIAPLDGDAADRLAELVRSSEIEVVIGADDVPRKVDATLDFGAAVPAELEDALGPYAAAQLRLVVNLDPGQQQ
jgi:hypothetical protein